jgi:thiamine-phosphate pyrophosphorylase
MSVGERLYVVTDRRLGDLPGLVARALAGVPRGSALVQLREKDLEGRPLFELATALRRVTALQGARLLVNDRLDVALACDADGVHLPENGLPVAEARALAPPGFLLGASAHDAETAAEKARQGADLIALGPVWETPSKVGLGPPIGLSAVREAVQRVGEAAVIFAIGGVDSADRARGAFEAGAHGVAAIRAVLAADDPAEGARSLLGEERA